MQVLADSAYGTGAMLAALADAGHEAIDQAGAAAPAGPGGFTIDDFTVDEAAGTVTCPTGLTRPISRSRQVVVRRRLQRLPAARPVHHQPRPAAA